MVFYRRWFVIFAQFFFGFACFCLLTGTSFSESANRIAPHVPNSAPLVGVTEQFYTDPLSGTALHGFDAVSYFLGLKPLAGLARFETVWMGVAWRFASEANLQAFLANPEIYAPRLGGYDAEAMGEGVVVSANPQLFAVLDNRLYIFRSAEGRNRFIADPDFRQLSEQEWQRVKLLQLNP